MKIIEIGIQNNYNGFFKIDRPSWTRDFLFLHFRTSATLILQGKETLVPKNSVILYHVNTPQLYYASEESYSDDYIHFSVEDDYDIFELINFPFNTPIPLPESMKINELLKYIYLEYISKIKQKDITIDLLLKLLFTKISEQSNTSCTLVSENETFNLLSSLRADIYLHPERNWSVHEIAKYTNFSMSYIQYLFKRAFGVSCIHTVIHSRIERSKFLLSTSNCSVKEVATTCGYNNDIAFMRQFKKFTKQTPSEFRVKNHL